MSENTSGQDKTLIKWALGILSAILIATVLGGSALLLRLDKGLAVQESELKHVVTSLQSISAKLEQMTINSQKINNLERDFSGINKDVSQISARLDDMDKTMRQGFSNLQDQIDR